MQDRSVDTGLVFLPAGPDLTIGHSVVRGLPTHHMYQNW
jgi:hypothetical protein